MPGGFGTRACWTTSRCSAGSARARDVDWTTSVCTGSLLLGAAGVLKGLEATSHWLVLDRWREFGAEPTRSASSSRARSSPRPACRPGSTWRCGSSQRIAGDDVAQAIQLGIEYDPQPPFDAGSPAKAPQARRGLVRAGSAKYERQPGSAGRAPAKLPADGKGMSCLPARAGLRPQPQPLDGGHQAALQPEPPEDPDRRRRHAGAGSSLHPLPEGRQGLQGRLDQPRPAPTRLPRTLGFRPVRGARHLDSTLPQGRCRCLRPARGTTPGGQRPQRLPCRRRRHRRQHGRRLCGRDAGVRPPERPAGRRRSAASEVVQAVARAALLGARGNSGVILSQIVRGAAEELSSRPGELVDPVLVSAALARAADAPTRRCETRRRGR